MKNKLFIIVLITIIISIIIPASAYAADATISSGGTYDLATYGDSSTITIATNDAITLTQSNASTPLDEFQIICSVPMVNLTIDGINIDDTGFPSYPYPLTFTGIGNTLEILSTNTLLAGYRRPAIKVDGITELAIFGTGTLNVEGGQDCPGIGGNYNKKTGSITINSGTIHADGGRWGAGIGSSNNGIDGSVAINGGSIYAQGGDFAQGIGMGSGGDGTFNITINEVDAINNPTYIEATGGMQGAGIGGEGSIDKNISGVIVSMDTNIEITGGTIIANGGSHSAGIGGSSTYDGGDITISGGNITATGGTYYAAGNPISGGAGIGGGWRGPGGTITITGGEITTIGAYQSAGIGGGDEGDGGTVTISGGAKVYAEEGENGGQPIGMGDNGSSSGSLTVSGISTVVFESGDLAGLFDAANLTLNDGIIYSDNTTNVNSARNAIGFAGISPWDTATAVYFMGNQVDFNINTTDTVTNLPNPNPQLVVENDYATEPTPEPSRTGYTLGGWFTDAGCTLGNEWDFASDTVTADMTLHAKWTANTYTVEFIGNGSDGGSMTNQTFAYDTTQNLSINGFTKTGYNFIGWSQSATGTVVYSDAQSVNNLSNVNGDTLTLYAIWEANTYTVEFIGNGNDGGSMIDQSFVYDTAQNLSTNGFTNTGYSFDGWATTANGTVVYADAQSVNNLTETSGDIITLYAKWTQDYYIITYDNNGGNGVIPSSGGTYGDIITLDDGSGFTRTDFVLDGWHINSSDYLLSALYTFTGTVTANAIWATDSDNDGVSDSDETATGTDPNNPSNVPQNGAIKITVLSNDGSPVSGYTVVLNSTPQVTTTYSEGNAAFADVGLYPHTLSLRNGNVQIGTYALNFTNGSPNFASIIDDASTDSNGIVNTIVSPNFLSLELIIQLNAANEWQLMQANFTRSFSSNQNSLLYSNPQTGDENVYFEINYALTTIILIVIVSLIFYFFKRRVKP